MSILDWILLGVVVLLALRCLVRGFVEELLSVAAYALGLGAAIFLYRPLGSYLAGRFAQLPLPEAIAFAVLFILGFLGTRLVGKLLKEGLEASALGGLDKAAGLALGLAEGLVIVSLVLLILKVQPIFDTKKLLDDSAFARAILPVVEPRVKRALGPRAEELKPAAPKVPDALKKLVPPAPSTPVQGGGSAQTAPKKP